MDLNHFLRQIAELPHVANLLSWVFFGLITGVVAKIVLPGQENLGWVRTIIVGIAGAFLGGFIASSMGYSVLIGWNVMGFAAAVGGSLILLIINRLVTKS